MVKVQQYSEEDILGKQLYFLIPYYILKYEHISEEDSLEEISEEYRRLYQGMMDARDAGLLNEYDMSNIVDFTNRLVEYVFRENQNAKREVSAVMRGQVLETYADRMIAKGRLEGKLEGKVAILYELDFTIDKIAERLSLSVEQVKEILEKCKI